MCYIDPTTLLSENKSQLSLKYSYLLRFYYLKIRSYRRIENTGDTWHLFCVIITPSLVSFRLRPLDGVTCHVCLSHILTRPLFLILNVVYLTSPSFNIILFFSKIKFKRSKKHTTPPAADISQSLLNHEEF